MRGSLLICFLVGAHLGLTAQTEVPPPPPPPSNHVVNNDKDEDPVPRLADFAKGVEQVNDKNNQISLVFWIPWQYWKCALMQFKNGQPLNDAELEVVNALKGYTVMCVVDGQPTVNGISYSDPIRLSDSIRLCIDDSVTLRPLDEARLNSTMTNVLAVMKPMMSSMLGQMGHNMAFFVFDNTNDKGQNYIDAAEPSKFSVSWKHDVIFAWDLPLDILIAPKYCPIDHTSFSGKYVYCPIHGVKLTDKK